MAFKEQQMFLITCDKCGAEESKDSNIAYWADKDICRDNSIEGNWALLNRGEKQERHYCPDCHSVIWDEEEDVKMIFVDGRQVGIMY